MIKITLFRLHRTGAEILYMAAGKILPPAAQKIVLRQQKDGFCHPNKKHVWEIVENVPDFYILRTFYDWTISSNQG